MAASPCIIDTSHYEAEDVHGAVRPALATAQASGIAALITQATVGVGYVDDALLAFADAARALDVLFGGYCFGTNVHPGDEQARYLCDHLEAIGCDLARVVVCLDFEAARTRGHDMTADQARAFRAYCVARIKRAPWLYGPRSWIAKFSDPKDPMGDCPLWIADDGGSLADPPKIPPGPWETRGWFAWQYTDGRYCAAGLPRVTPGFGHIDRSVVRMTPQELAARWPAAAA